MTDRRRFVISGEMLAIDPAAIQRSADGFFWMQGPESPPNSRHATFEDVAIVHVRGSLEHHVCQYADSYEGIEQKLACAAAGTDGDERRDPPSAIIMCIDSRGGVVAGLNETVARIQRAYPRSGIQLVAYINEMATSAAFAMACSCHEILGPPTCITGSIGTISTMMSCAKQDEMMGVDVRLITSGARKSDGHPHAPITDAAEAAERDRVEKLAVSFLALAGAARGISPRKLDKLEAGIFLGPDAKARGLLDGLVSIDDVARAVSRGRSAGHASSKGNETDRRAAT